MEQIIPEEISEKLATVLYHRAVASFASHLSKHSKFEDAFYIADCNSTIKKLLSDLATIEHKVI